MEISGKVLREVEFRDRLRGYDTDEVDEFLEKVAVAVDEMQAELGKLASRSQSHVRPIDEAPAFDDDSIRRTLVLAQRTADLAVSEAREEADRLLDDARQQSELMLAQAHEAVRRLRNDAEQDLHDRVSRLEGERDRLERETGSLVGLLESERERLTQGLSSALRFVEETLAVSRDLVGATERRPGTPERTGPELVRSEESAADGEGDATERPAPEPPAPLARQVPTPTGIPDVEAEITEDAATAARREQPADEPGRFGLSQSTSPPPALDADEALWARWAAGGGLEPPTGTVERTPADTPLRFDRRPDGGRSA
ncbi:MAG: DivIVA protein [Acidimicrobiaceae bacterium]|jgi:DivIVA domain-containing protein|nr:DivIVA protein [Acidimicrobiaceae bacterium]